MIITAAATKEADNDEDWIAAERDWKRPAACPSVELASRR
jgi:hypothetical protein